MIRYAAITSVVLWSLDLLHSAATNEHMDWLMATGIILTMIGALCCKTKVHE